MKTLCGLVLGLLVGLTGCLPGPEEAGSKALPSGGQYRQVTLATGGGVDGRYEVYVYEPGAHRLAKTTWPTPAVPPPSVELTSEQVIELEAALEDIQLDTRPATSECHPDALQLQLEYVDAAGETRIFRADRHLCINYPSVTSLVKAEDFQTAFLLCRRLYSEQAR